MIELAKKLEEKAIPEPNSGCLLWTGAISGKGYGGLSYRGRQLRAHRAAYEVAHGPIPKGMLVCHKCDVRLCVNPDHLFLGSDAENVRDMHAKGRARPAGAKGEKHGKAKLTSPEVMAIRADRRAHSTIARIYGITRSYVSNLKRGVNWTHLGGINAGR